VVNGPRSRSIRMLCLVGAVAMVASACGSSKKVASSTSTTTPTTTATGSTGSTGSGNCSSGNTASAPGVTPTTIKLGLITSLTGVEGEQFNPGAQQGADARLKVQNAEGGVDCRQLQMTVADDGSTPQGAATATSELLSKNIFGLMTISGVYVGGYRIAHQAGVPVVGAAVDGPEWGEQPNTNMFSVAGDQGAVPAVSTLMPNVMKLLGATNTAALAYGNSAASSFSAEAFVAGAKLAGLHVGYTNYSISLGSLDVSPVALAMKQAHIDSFYAAMIEDTNFALLTDLHQEGVDLKAPVLATGYGSTLFSDPEAAATAQGAVFEVSQVPFELHTAATQAEQAAFAKYEKFTGIPNLNWTYGWTVADLMIKGLEVAGQNPTRQSFMTGLRGVTGYDAGGLYPRPLDLSLADFGKIPTSEACEYFVQVEGKQFVVLNHNQPVCGTQAPPSS
jgi:branched-chain amino acid transport system substrate-binding protein